ncbi:MULTISPECIES: histone deacetylase family protein [Stenotrophomonas]|jgi:acetoin utilization deacetylase AcuC-like enzyme|uniref:Histone deacetylase family protein n=1 Tax=Stenotrophomonas acidaminiphila TaxID=128780 RepID=A0A0R0DH38_9GAMM|nr:MULTISPECIES: histone deacetylase family protein [Stenotrophomonas]ALJ29294.1 histone deacetylase family protein [Stenotrophomonas acidaminiphila]KRG80886.1 acetoin utilization protein [Stenotrophomonas acidaminiphila]MCA7023222.1 histone deacetylase family protein [Stenotrophomonas acidaminiphila]MCE4076379.1 histone deacetylase family protein [Stenotrophomonas acidaminiphila]QOF98012.1 histone deacetylase family protein [Stenotrophomonas sp. CW117]
MLVFTHTACLGHDPGPDHPESPERLRAVLDALRAAFPDQLDWREAPPAKLGELARVHTRELIDDMLQAQTAPLRRIDLDTFTSPGSASAALHAAGAGVAAVDAVMRGPDRRAFCAVRPPGHHATADTAMGFCLFNNIAVAAAYARDVHGLERIAIVDFDVHHGNGTQAIFETDPRVAYYSSHESGLFPYSGNMRERGVGNVCNILLPPGSGGFRFRNTWADELLPLVDAFRPQLLFVSAGFDAHLHDPQADLMVETEDFGWLTTELAALADRHADGRLVSMLEGGYDLQALAESSVAHVDALLAR